MGDKDLTQTPTTQAASDTSDKDAQPIDSQTLRTASTDPLAQTVAEKIAIGTNTGAHANLGNVIVPSVKIPETKPIAQVDLGHAWDTSTVRPGSMAYHMATMMMSPQFAAMSQKFGPMGAFAFAAPAITADAHQGVTPPGSTEPQSPQQSAGDLAGNVTWNAAQKNDTSMPINPHQTPQQSTGQKLQQGIYSTLGGLFDMNVSAADMGRRMEETNRTNALNALTNIQMVREQQLLHLQAQKTIDQAAQVGKSQFDFLLTAPEAKFIGEGLTSDQIQQGLQGPNNPNGPYNPHTMQIFQTGRVQIGTDKTGQPQYRSTYSVLMPGGPITMGLSAVEKTGNAMEGAKLSPSQREAAENQEEIRKYMNHNLPGQHIEAGQQLPSSVYGALFQRANDLAGMRSAAIANNKKFDAEMKEIEWTDNDKNFAAEPLVANTIKHNYLDRDDQFAHEKAFLDIRHAIAQNDDQGREYLKQLGPDWEKQYIHTFSNGDPVFWQKRLDAYFASRGKGEDEIAKLSTDPKEVLKDPAGALGLVKQPIADMTKQIQASQEIIDKNTASLNDPKNKNMDPEVRDRLQNEIDQEMQKGKDAKTKLTAYQKIAQEAEDIKTAKQKQKADEAGAETEARQKAQQGEYAGDSNLQGQAYLDSIDDIGLKNGLVAVAEGREFRSERQLQDKQGNMSLFAKELNQAFPDINIANTASYKKNLQEWTSNKTGTAGGQLSNGATALKHLKELDTLFKANPGWTKAPQSEAYVRYNNLKDTLADELMKFYGAPSTNEVIAAYKNTIASFFNREAAISEQAKAMAEKFGSMEQTWKNLSPRKSYSPPMPPIDDDAKGALNYFAPGFVTSHPQFQVGYKPTVANSTVPTDQQVNTNKTDVNAHQTTTKFSVTPPGMNQPIYFDTQEQLDAFKKKAKL